MSFCSDAHLLLGSESGPPEVSAWQHPEFPDSFTVTLDTHDRHGRVAITGNPSQLLGLLTQMTTAVTDTAGGAGQLPAREDPAQPGARSA